MLVLFIYEQINLQIPFGKIVLLSELSLNLKQISYRRNVLPIVFTFEDVQINLLLLFCKCTLKKSIWKKKSYNINPDLECGAQNWTVKNKIK